MSGDSMSFGAAVDALAAELPRVAPWCSQAEWRSLEAHTAKVVIPRMRMRRSSDTTPVVLHTFGFELVFEPSDELLALVRMLRAWDGAEPLSALLQRHTVSL